MLLRAVLLLSAVACSRASSSSSSSYIGKTITLYNRHQQRFVRMAPHDRQVGRPNTCTDMDKSNVLEDPTLIPDSWQWEMFKVVDVGNGTIALYNIVHKRFVRMPPALGHLDVSIQFHEPKLPANFEWERFHLVEAADAPNQFGLWHAGHQRFVTMSIDAEYLESSAKRIVAGSARSWPEERFQISVVHPDPATPPEGSFELLDPELCPRWHPEVVLVVAGLGSVTVIAVPIAIGALVYALKFQRVAVAKMCAHAHDRHAAADGWRRADDRR